jgi:hypothetical protein
LNVRRLLPGFLFAGALLLSGLARWLIERGLPSSPVLWLDLASIVALALVFRGRPGSEPAAPVAPPAKPPAGTRRIGAILLVVGWVVLIALSVALYRDWRSHLIRAFWIGPLGLLALALGLDTLRGYGSRWRLRIPKPSEWPRGEVLVLLAILLVGLFFRFRSFGTFPPVDGFSSLEESQLALSARQIVEQGQRPWEWPLSLYVPAGSFALFGCSMPALRIPATVLNWLSLIPFFLFCRALTRSAPALFATALLAVSRWHVQMSWYNDEVYVSLWWFVLVLWVLWKTEREARPLWYVLLGALTGYSLHHYVTFRTTLPVVLAFFLIEGVRGARQPGRGRLVAVFGALVILFALPLVARLREDKPNYYLEPLTRSMADTGYYTRDIGILVHQRLDRMKAATAMFTVIDNGIFFETLNAAGRPLLDPFTGAVFLLGLGTAAAFPLRRHNLFLVGAFLALWLAVTTVPHNLDYRRLAILCPFVFAFSALFAEGCLALDLPRTFRRLTAAGLILVVGLAAWSNDRFLFHVLATNTRTRAAHRNDYTTAAFYVHHHGRGEYVVILTPEDGYVVSNFFDANDYSWILPAGIKGRVVLKVQDVLDPPSALRSPTGTLILIQPNFDLPGVIGQIRGAYPDADCRIQLDDAERQYDLGACRIPPPTRR